MRIYLDNCCYNRPYDDQTQFKVTMETLREKMDIVDIEQFIFQIKTEAFDYTKWQRDYFDAMSPDEIDKAVDRFSAENEFNGKKATVI